AALDLLGYTRDEYVGHHLSEFQADGAVPDDLLDRLAAGEPARDVPIRLRGKDGTLRDLLLDASPYLAGGYVRYSRWFTRDVTAQRLAEEAARWTQERFELAARATEALMRAWHLAGGEADWAGATSAFFGAPGEPGLQSPIGYEP